MNIHENAFSFSSYGMVAGTMLVSPGSVCTECELDVFASEDYVRAHIRGTRVSCVIMRRAARRRYQFHVTPGSVGKPKFV